MNVIIGNAWPYANGPLHLGRIAVLLPGDVLARYHRAMGDKVIFVSGSDSHGNLVALQAKEEGKTPLETSEKYHEEFAKCFKALEFSFDIFTKTHTKYHINKVQEFILDLYKKGYIYEKEAEYLYCDKCENVVETSDCLDKRCKFCGGTFLKKINKHLFFALSKFEKDIRRLLIRQSSWRENAVVITKRYVEEGLRDRAVTRDFHWGIDVPIEGYKDKKIYVWIEAVLGYLTASMKCISERGEDYLEYWNGEDSRIYFVHGKDNIPFHTVIFPSLLAGLGIKNPNIREISSEYLKLEGKSFSTIKNWAIWVDDLVKKYNVDSLRYYLILNGPEEKDSDFTWRNFVNTNNNDLASLYGNFVNRVFSFIKNNFNGEIPKGYVPQNIKDEILNIYFDVADYIEAGELKKSLKTIFNMVKKANEFLDKGKPWITFRKDINACSQTIYVALQLVLNISNLLDPFLPISSAKIRKALKLDSYSWSYTEKSHGIIEDIEVLFEKIDKEKVAKELEILKKIKSEYRQ